MTRPTLIRHQGAAQGQAGWMGNGASAVRNKNILMGIGASVAITAAVYYWGFREVHERHKGQPPDIQRTT
ncbi:hypothetical protein LshimejAT787_1101180 [Lyophyllum shimeji]|uniref:Uncharacterized protein n=1 Tax=Lyophyllum shimeji TaxID=47721 RepID=A0A9P3PU72_LYOSH|nr:hypothetical protein LshimejAT787_1101180 [Lyophyllum shimeji]